MKGVDLLRPYKWESGDVGVEEGLGADGWGWRCKGEKHAEAEWVE